MEDKEDHSRSIIHIKSDCCSVQGKHIIGVESIPIAIQQNNIIFTCNHIALRNGIQRNMSVSEAQKLCPNLVLISDVAALHEYRQLSYAVTAHLQKFSKLVERLGLEENYIDVSDLVSKNELQASDKLIGEGYGSLNNLCQCGCFDRLKLASNIASQINRSLQEEFGMHSTITVAHNKLLSKLVGDLQWDHKQVVVFPPNGIELILGKTINEIPGISKTVLNSLNEKCVQFVKDLRSCDLNEFNDTFSKETIKYLKDLSCGMDSSPVKSRYFTLEDASRPLTVEMEVKETLSGMLMRLLALLAKDKRIPRRMELLVRKYDTISKFSRKELKHVNLPPKLFLYGTALKISDSTKRQLLSYAMKLFLKTLDTTKPYHITLLGLSFQRFPELSANLLERRSLEVQAVTNIEYTPYLYDVTNQMEYSTGQCDTTDGSETELEPSPKKRKCTALPCRSFFDKQCPSPSKLKVAELRINSEVN